MPDFTNMRLMSCMALLLILVGAPAPSVQAQSDPQLRQPGRSVEPSNEGGSNLPQTSTLEIPAVPKVFEGCWQGTVTRADSWERFGGPRLEGWVPVTYKLCFRRVGDGPFKITFQKADPDTAYAAERGHEVTNYDQQTEVVSSDGKGVINLHSVGSADETAHKPGCLLPLFGSCTVTVTIGSTSDTRCALAEGGSALMVQSSNLQRCSGAPEFGCNGQPWVSATWHADFTRASE